MDVYHFSLVLISAFQRYEFLPVAAYLCKAELRRSRHRSALLSGRDSSFRHNSNVHGLSCGGLFELHVMEKGK